MKYINNGTVTNYMHIVLGYVAFQLGKTGVNHSSNAVRELSDLIGSYSSDVYSILRLQMAAEWGSTFAEHDLKWEKLYIAALHLEDKQFIIIDYQHRSKGDFKIKLYEDGAREAQSMINQYHMNNDVNAKRVKRKQDIENGIKVSNNRSYKQAVKLSNKLSAQKLYDSTVPHLSDHEKYQMDAYRSLLDRGVTGIYELKKTISAPLFNNLKRYASLKDGTSEAEIKSVLYHKVDVLKKPYQKELRLPLKRDKTLMVLAFATLDEEGSDYRNINDLYEGYGMRLCDGIELNMILRWGKAMPLTRLTIEQLEAFLLDFEKQGLVEILSQRMRGGLCYKLTQKGREKDAQYRSEFKEVLIKRLNVFRLRMGKL